ncbi:MAG: hypothetical protein NTV34_17295 [Proteobacteria bacterium]|nr:hypothetical protein [Pseudomonadota bacterium]
MRQSMVLKPLTCARNSTTRLFYCSAKIGVAAALLSASHVLADSMAIPTKDAKASVLGHRTIYMNGIDISSARNQDLRNVHIKIDEYGNLFVTAPQYQVTEEETFTPLSSYKHASELPEHKPPQPLLGRGPERDPQPQPKLGGDSALAAPVSVSQKSGGASSGVIPATPQNVYPAPAPNPDMPAANRAQR